MVRDNQELREKTQTENQAEVGDARPKGANTSDRSKHQTWKLWRHAKNSHMSDNTQLLTLYLSIHQSTHLSTYLSLCLSICLSIYEYNRLSLTRPISLKYCSHQRPTPRPPPPPPRKKILKDQKTKNPWLVRPSIRHLTMSGDLGVISTDDQTARASLLFDILTAVDLLAKECARLTPGKTCRK